MAYKKDDIPKVTIDRMKIGGKELSEEVANNILNGNFELEIEKIAKDIAKRQDNAMAMEFTKCIGELLKKNGVVPKLTEYRVENHEENFLHSKYEMKYGISIDELDFSEHDKVFEDKIEDLESLMQKQDEFLEMKNMQVAELKQRIAELEGKEIKKPKNGWICVVAKEINGQEYVRLEDFMRVVNDFQEQNRLEDDGK